MKEKFIMKWMRVAKQIGEDENPCFSRKIGVVIVDPVTNTIRGTGYNGPAPGVPHCDTRDHLENFFWPQLSNAEKAIVSTRYGDTYLPDHEEFHKKKFLDTYTNCGQCPRRLVKAAAGQRNELCSCGHAERHAITNAGTCHGYYMFCYCGVPCIQCTDAIIQAGIKKVYHLDDTDYHPVARWMFEKAGVELVSIPRKVFEGGTNVSVSKS